jgi:DNA-binding response OmpR family regulator
MHGIGSEERTHRERRLAARVLVVEDDDAMRALLTETLLRDGYDVRAAASGIEATKMIEAMTLHEWSTRALDLVLSDVRMPGLSGLRLGDMVRDARWGTPLIFITAFPDDDVHTHAAELGATVLAKPFAMELLRRTVLTTIAARVRVLHAAEDARAK